jgi:hypothetical protein
MNIPLLPLTDLAERHKGLTPALAECYLEAARVCLDRHHISPKEFQIKNGTLIQRIQVEWELTDERCRGAWANKDDATRDGAYACAIATTELTLGLFAVRRAETLTGADYYIAPANLGEDLEDCLRLEVSGTDSDDYEVARRLRIKVKQAQEGKSNLPALAVIIGFRVQLILMQTVQEKS